MHLNLARFHAANITDCLEKPVKTTCDFVNIARKAKIARQKVFFFSLNYKSFSIQTGFEQLSSSIRWQVMAIRKVVFSSPDWVLWLLKYSPSFGVLSIIFCYRYVRKSFKGSKDADFGLVSENILSQNNGTIGWGPGPGKCIQKHSHLWRSPRKLSPKTKIFFLILTTRLTESVEGLNSSLAQSPSWL